ncbi:MAG: pantetheine-phosphate adenylyltransferase [Brachybacterium sp.]|nr:pantetheine-phosphate adenylyltransferase [Brachybacterium sp.]
MSTVVLPGSFDPFTLGHLDIARRAAALVDEVVIALAKNPNKRGLLGLDERCRAIDETLAEQGLQDRVRTAVLDGGLLVDFCRSVGARAVVRGLRSQADLAYEEPMVRMNAHLADIDTMLLLTTSSYAHISSSLVREVARLGGDVTDMLPAPSRRALERALGPTSPTS